MKLKTSTRISLIFSVITFFIVWILLISLNIITFFWWYDEEKNEVTSKIDSEYNEVLKDNKHIHNQKEDLSDELKDLWGFFSDTNNILLYNNIFLDFYYKDGLYFIIYEKETKFWNIFIPYDVTSHFHTQIRFVYVWLILLFIFTILSYFISKVLFIKFALKDIFYISNKLKKIDLNNITKIKLDLTKNDEIKELVDSINNFLTVIEHNTKSLKEFNIQVSHEFKTPLMVISSELEYLWLYWKNTDSYKKIDKQVDLLNQLLETFLFISKIENFKWDIKKDNINIWSIISKELENLNKIYRTNNINIVFDNNKIIKLKSNKKLIEVIIKNILDNAFKYSNVWWKIIIDFNKDYLIIKDNWIWIDKRNLSKIFDSFYRVWNDYKWYWIGLNIVKKIVNILWYEIKVKSIKNKWTEFKIIF